jgi:uncharacterized protein YndB with AHSA1/START domain
MATIHLQVLVEAPRASVYRAIATADGISTWWDKQTPRQTREGIVLEHNPGADHGVVMLRVVELVPDERIEWECISTHPESSPASAWTGTQFIFDLSVRDNATAVDFRQIGYNERSPFFTTNREAWRTVLENLKRAVEQD